MARRLDLIACLAVLVASTACGSSLPTPETKAHPSTTRFVEVPYPPPAARAEVVPSKPREGAVWIDGEWSWQGRQWIWEPGGWVMAPAKTYYSPWIAFHQADGKLVFAPGAWHDESGQMLPKPTPIAPAQSSLEPEGKTAPSPVAQPDAGASSGAGGTPY